MKAWPASGGFRVATFQELIPVYKAADVVAGTVKVEQVLVDGAAGLETAPGLGRLVTAAAAATMAARGAERPALTTT